MNRTALGAAIVASVIGWGVLAAGQAPPPATTAPADRTILATGGLWRAFAMSGPERLAGEFAGQDQQDVTRVFGQTPTTDGPPAGWASADFDDSAWRRSGAPFGGLPKACKGLFLRGRFAVSEPDSVGRLSLSLAYRGGVAVHLNGREVFRRDLPDGPIQPTTPGATYGPEAYVDAAGAVVEPYVASQRIRAGDKDLAERLATRDRRAGPIDLPTSLLRKGVNVLAVEVHRSDLRPEVFKWGNRDLHKWPHVQLDSIRLATDGTGVSPNVARPEGLQLWSRDIHDIFSTDDRGDPNEPLRPIRLVAPRSGFCSGQVVVGSTEPLDRLEARPGALKHADGRATIAASQLRVRFSGLSTLEITARHEGLDFANYTPVPAFCGLLDGPPGRIDPAAFRTNERERARLFVPPKLVPAAVQPVWLTVQVPKDATPGTYRGQISIQADGGVGVIVPVELEVIDWTAPDPKDFTTCMAVNQSPESLAVHYGVEMWSERHWQLMERSFRLLGHVGNNLLIVPLVCRTQYGNDEGLIPWIRQADGSYGYDFTVHDRLVGLARGHCDIRVISYQVYLSNDWVPPGPDKPTFVTVIDPATGQRSAMQLPAYGTEECGKLFRPLIEQLRQRHQALGLDGRTRIVLGVGQDGGVHKTVVDQFKELWPQALWHYGAHNRPHQRFKPGLFGYSEYLYVGPIPPPGAGRRYPAGDQIVLMSQRIYGANQWPLVTRTMAERALVRGDNGAGRMCLDYWPVAEGRPGRKDWLYDRWPESRSNQRAPHLRNLAVPGADGPVMTAKLAVMREGLQEAEARVFIERALAAGTLPPALAQRAQRILDRRVEELRAIDYVWEPVRPAYGLGWQAGAAELFCLAGEVAGLPAAGPKAER